MEETTMKFEIGREYRRPGLFGPSYWVVCVERTETTAKFIGEDSLRETEIDHAAYDTLDIEHDGDTEVCECWEYRGHRGYIRADSRF